MECSHQFIRLKESSNGGMRKDSMRTISERAVLIGQKAAVLIGQKESGGYGIDPYSLT